MLMKAVIEVGLALLQIMSETISKARDVHKENWPVIEKFEVPIHKRSQFLGVGGLNLKRITAKTGVTLIQVDENSFDVFAPNQVRISLLVLLLSGAQ